VVFFGVDQELARRFGAANGGAANFIRESSVSMLPWTQAHGASCHDIGLLTASSPSEVGAEIGLVSRAITQAGLRPVLIGCDHTASIANFVGAPRPMPVAYLYLDAHFDLGFHRERTAIDSGNFVASLLENPAVESVVNIGGRSWATFHPAYRAVAKFTSIAGRSMDALAATLARLEAMPVYVSIDADVLDPSVADLSCPEPFGMMPRDVLALCDWIGGHCDVVGADLCELIPSRRNIGVAQALMLSLHALFSRGPGRTHLY
jgi:agmatinase